jgi:hypothetical protein
MIERMRERTRLEGTSYVAGHSDSAYAELKPHCSLADAGVSAGTPFESSPDRSDQSMISLNIVLHGASRPSGRAM